MSKTYRCYIQYEIVKVTTDPKTYKKKKELHVHATRYHYVPSQSAHDARIFMQLHVLPKLPKDISVRKIVAHAIPEDQAMRAIGAPSLFPEPKP